MPALEQDTIVAISTPVGRGGIGIVRLSGPRAREIAAPMLRLRHELEPGRARFGELVELGEGKVRVLDEVVATYFAAPHSYTGEDVIEIAMHGAPVLLEYLVRQCCRVGRDGEPAARLAEPGEFTQRAFLAGRIDLTQAEAVGDLIESSTMEQARVAARQMGGALAREIAPAKAELVGLIAAMEAGIDFAEDDIDVIAAEEIARRIAAVREPLATTGAELRGGARGARGVPAGDCGAAECGQIEPVQPAGRARTRHRDGHSGDDARSCNGDGCN